MRQPFLSQAYLLRSTGDWIRPLKCLTALLTMQGTISVRLSAPTSVRSLVEMETYYLFKFTLVVGTIFFSEKNKEQKAASLSLQHMASFSSPPPSPPSPLLSSSPPVSLSPCPHTLILTRMWNRRKSETYNLESIPLKLMTEKNH